MNGDDEDTGVDIIDIVLSGYIHTILLELSQ